MIPLYNISETRKGQQSLGFQRFGGKIHDDYCLSIFYTKPGYFGKSAFHSTRVF